MQERQNSKCVIFFLQTHDSRFAESLKLKYTRFAGNPKWRNIYIQKEFERKIGSKKRLFIALRSKASFQKFPDV
jgi:hypothetical protein